MFGIGGGEGRGVALGWFLVSLGVNAKNVVSFVCLFVCLFVGIVGVALKWWSSMPVNKKIQNFWYSIS